MVSMTRWKRSRLVHHRHIERRRDRPLFLVAADMDVVVIGAPIGQPVNQPRIGMEGEDHRLFLREKPVEISIAQPVRMLGSAAAIS